MAETIDKKLLKRLRVLYVEDDDTVRTDLSSLFSNFFATVFTASNGEEGLSLYKEKQDEIDVIVADINMPVLNGIQMLEKIREFDETVPTILATAYSDNSFLIDAIKLKVTDYIIKPIDIRILMASLNEIAKTSYHDFLVNQQNKELKKYRDIIYSNNIVITTNKQMKITHVNNLFCEITGFDKEELLNKEFDSLKYSDADKNLYNKIYASIMANENWTGELKNKTKDGKFYYADTIAVATLSDTGEITGSLIIQKDQTEKMLKRREIQNSLIKDKSEIFQKSKKSSAEQNQTINSLSSELEKEKQEKNSNFQALEKYRKENKKLIAELTTFRKLSETANDAGKKILKLTKENSDLGVKLKRLTSKLEMIEEDHKKELKQQKISYELKIDDIEKSLTDSKEKLEIVDGVEAISQKLAYWKEKAKKEAKKNEKLEREIINFGDKNLMSKLFGGR